MPWRTDSDVTHLTDEVPALLCQGWPPQIWDDLHVAIALSGGCDSMALLRAVLEVKQRHQGVGRITAMHVNHHLRGAESDQDALWCEQQCKKLGVPLQLLDGGVDKQAEIAGDGLEAAAREVRYKLLAESAEREGIRYVATAHSQDDQVETVLFRLLRGSGLQGLRGIPRTRKLTPAVTLVRPLLGCTRRKLEAYLEEIGQPYRIDGTNEQMAYTRNRLRHELLPQIRSDFNHEVDDALLRLSSQAEQLQEFVESQARDLLNTCLIERIEPTSGGGELTLSLAKLPHEAEVVVREALRLAWRGAGLAEQDMTYSWWRKLTQLAMNPDAADALNLPGNVFASVVADNLILRW